MTMGRILAELNNKSTPELLQIMQTNPQLQTPAYLLLDSRKRNAANALMQPDNGQSLAANMPQDISKLVQGIQQLGQQPPAVNPAAQPPQPMPPQQGQPQGAPPQQPPQAPPQQGPGFAGGGLVSFDDGGRVGLEHLARKVIAQRQMADRKTRGVFPQPQMDPSQSVLKKPKEGFAEGGRVGFADGAYIHAIRNADPLSEFVPDADPINESDPYLQESMLTQENNRGLARDMIAPLSKAGSRISKMILPVDDIASIPDGVRNFLKGDNAKLAAADTARFGRAPAGNYKGTPSPGDFYESQAGGRPMPTNGVRPEDAAGLAAVRRGAASPQAAAAVAAAASQAPRGSTYEEDLARLNLGARPSVKSLTEYGAEDQAARRAMGLEDKPYADLQKRFASMSGEERDRATSTRDEGRNMALLSMAAKMLDAPRVGGVGGGLMGIGQGVQAGLPMMAEATKDYNKAMNSARKFELESELAFKKGDVDAGEKAMARAQKAKEDALAIQGKHEDREIGARTGILSAHINKASAERVAEGSNAMHLQLGREHNAALIQAAGMKQPGAEMQLFNAYKQDPEGVGAFISKLKGGDTKQMQMLGGISAALEKTPFGTPAHDALQKQLQTLLSDMTSGIAASRGGANLSAADRIAGIGGK